jgi:uncharacterized OB-fold protein
MPEPATLPVVPPSPLPEVAPHFAGLRAGRLVLPRCDACGTLIWYPRAFCPHCSSQRVTWEDVDGGGRIHSYTVVRRGVGAFAEHVPYVVAYVDLDAGPRVLTNVVGAAPDDLAVDARVRAVVESGPDSEPILRFRLA